MTTLSTTGFGDYYPVSDGERIVGSFMLFFGVMLFSVFMGLLIEMVTKINSLDYVEDKNEELDKFFMYIEIKYCKNEALPSQLKLKIQQFLEFKSKNNRNNFLSTKNDQAIFDQLSSRVQLAIFTDFIYKEFLWKFRRFFSFRISMLKLQDKLDKDHDPRHLIINKNL